jgi:hypothetical protein
LFLVDAEQIVRGHADELGEVDQALRRYRLLSALNQAPLTSLNPQPLCGCFLGDPASETKPPEAVCNELSRPRSAKCRHVIDLYDFGRRIV